MKTFKTFLALIAALLLPLGLFASPSSAALGDPDTGDAANLYQDVSTSDHTHLNPPFNKDQQIGIQANFDGGATSVTLYRKIGAGAWTFLDSKTSNSSGNAYFSYKVLAGEQQLFAETSGDVETEVDIIDGVIPPPQVGVLNAPTNNGKNWTADFTPAIAGKSTQLQIQRIWTKETDEVNEAPGTPEKGPWVTIATANQDAAGHVVFPALSSPYPYRVSHK
ncbi:hypothetical protein, partial [Aeromicrobium sp.]|uniref:hypothetical protein n=1 Tax=Aeromicrobium sp. TaxID=1871063 RepID=UPI003C57257D